MEWRTLQFDGYNTFSGYADGYLDNPIYLEEYYKFKTGELMDAYQNSAAKYAYYGNQEQTSRNIARRSSNLSKQGKYSILLTSLGIEGYG